MKKKMTSTMLKVIGVGLGLSLVAGVVMVLKSQTNSVAASEEGQMVPGTQMEDRLDDATVRLGELTYPSSAEADRVAKQTKALDIDQEGFYEAGFEDMIVLDLWLCSWLDEANEAHEAHDDKRAEKATSNLATAADIPQYQESWEGVESWVQSVVVPAQNGDFTELKEYESVQCGGTR